jgi:hypothetical protein
VSESRPSPSSASSSASTLENKKEILDKERKEDHAEEEGEEEDESSSSIMVDSHISTVQTIGNTVFVVAETMMWRYSWVDINLALYKLARDDDSGSFDLDLVCTPFDLKKKKKISLSQIVRSDDPCKIAISERYILVLGIHSRLFQCNHVTGDVIKNEQLEICGYKYYNRSVHIVDTFYVIRSCRMSCDIVILGD